MDIYKQLDKYLIKNYPSLKKGYNIVFLGKGKPDVVVTNRLGKHISPIYNSFEELLKHYGIKEGK